MRRKRTTTGETIEAGQDSFLDIVSNMVGILIILVVVAGLRVRDLPILSRMDEEKINAAAEIFDRQQAAYNNITLECLKLTEDFELMKGLHESKRTEYQQIIDDKVLLEHAIQSHVQTLDADSRTGFELQRQLAEVDVLLEKLGHEKNWLNQQKPNATVIENIPTPISSNANDEREVHFRILNGRISHVPFKYFRTQMETEIMRRRNDLMSQPRITGSLGPIDGFRMQYSVIRQDLPIRLAQEVGIRSEILFEHCEMVPVGDDRMLGETLEKALLPNSAFNMCLLACRQNEYSVTVWVYPDSFSEFQKIKNYLYRSGYKTAARPMDFGQPITASPQGTKSANQ
jgi:hypothetical protein